MSKISFSEFEPIVSKQWKQQIQFDLKGADYNETLLWESPEGIKIKPFYHIDEFEKSSQNILKQKPFEIIQNIFVHDVEKSVKRTLDVLHRGAESIRFTIENEQISFENLFQSLPKTIPYYVHLPFLSETYVNQMELFNQKHGFQLHLILDPIEQLMSDGNWYVSLEHDFQMLNQINQSTKSFGFITIKNQHFQNAGANMVQQLAYSLAHLNEYLNRIKQLNSPILIEIAVGSHYFFEIAKIKALRWLVQTLLDEYEISVPFKILVTPTKRNKTIYDYNVNMLRTTTECMSGILGGADGICNLPYDALYHKDNEFGDRIARNQLLILKHESYLDKNLNPTEGAYFIENITEQLAEKALQLFKDIEKGGGLITQLIEGTIQRKIQESAQKEQDLFDSGKEVLIGTNKHPNLNDRMKDDLELYPFMKKKTRKTLITPIIEKRLAEKMEQERLKNEENE
jgi:methylmalonyl-CoA mutase